MVKYWTPIARIVVPPKVKGTTIIKELLLLSFIDLHLPFMICLLSLRSLLNIRPHILQLTINLLAPYTLALGRCRLLFH